MLIYILIMETLIQYAKTYEKLYKLEQNPGIFHVACSCVTGQQVSFSIGRSIRRQLYAVCGNPITQKALLSCDLTTIRSLTPIRAELLRKMAEIDDTRSTKDVLVDYCKLAGFGKWTKNAISIILGIDDSINLSDDLYIRKNLALYIGKPSINQKECHNYILAADNNQTLVCYFLWRLRPNSVDKVKNNIILDRSDFV